jgi:glycosyltransferase involved in cell wall biosynthesis
MVNEMARLGRDRWEISVVAPEFFPGDLGPIRFEAQPAEIVAIRSMPVHFAKRIHWMLYSRQLKGVLQQSWDLVHCWEEPYILSAAQVAWWTPRSIPLVFYTFQNISKNYPPPFGLIERYCIDRCSAWVAGAESVELTLLNRGYDIRPHRVIPLSVDQTIFRPQPRLRTLTLESLGWDGQSAPVIGYLGRFVAEKGLKTLAAALDTIRTPWRLLIVGGGQLEGWIRDWARPYGDRVRIVAPVSHKQVPAYLNAMDILCAPSRTTAAWREQFGRMIIEAFACGLPVIGSDSGEIPSVIGDAGLIVSADNRAAWASAIGQLLDAPELRNELACRGLQRITKHFSLETVARRHLAFFEEMVDGQGSAKERLRGV